MNFAPVAILACKRPEHLARLLTSLSANPEALETTLTIFIGGPKRHEDWDLVRKTVLVAQEASGFRQINVETCFELTASNELIQYGITSILTANSRVIVLEDDLVVRRDFLLYMNTSLDRYQDDKRVVQISGWNFGIMKPESPQQTHFLSNTTSWGWATWKRAWNVDPQLLDNFSWLVKRSRRIHDFNVSESYDCLGMIEAVIRDGYSAWDACWYLDCFRNDLLVLYPNSSLVINEGFDGSGLNFDFSFDWGHEFSEEPQVTFRFPKSVEVTQFRRAYLKNYRRWVRASINKNILFPYVIARKVRQHQTYYKPGFYKGWWNFRIRRA
jgi:hypothetical protein